MTLELILLCLAAFLAGFADAITGGGGLIQVPAGLILMPRLPVVTVIATLKIPALTGTTMATIQFAQKVNMQWKSFTWITLIAFFSAIAGSFSLHIMPNHFMKPVIFIMLTAVALYTFVKKDFGTSTGKNHNRQQEPFYGSLIGLIIGFYDGFIGPGAGSFLILAFISMLGFDFLKASAHAKLVNMATNFGSLLYFSTTGLIIYKIAIPMALCNGLGGLLGARLAILKGNRFVRIFFLIIIAGTILRFAYDIIKTMG